jgi:hypothetical protein
MDSAHSSRRAAVFSAVFSSVINASTWKLHRLPLRFASHLRQLPFQLRGPLFRVRQPPLQLRNASVPFATPRTRRQ